MKKSSLLESLYIPLIQFLFLHCNLLALCKRLNHYLFIYINFYEVKTHIADVKLFYHVIGGSRGGGTGGPEPPPPPENCINITLEMLVREVIEPHVL